MVGQSKKHDVLTDAQGETYVSEATVVPVATEEEIYKVACSLPHTACPDSNINPCQSRKRALRAR